MRDAASTLVWTAEWGGESWGCRARSAANASPCVFVSSAAAACPHAPPLVTRPAPHARFARRPRGKLVYARGGDALPGARERAEPLPGGLQAERVSSGAWGLCSLSPRAAVAPIATERHFRSRLLPRIRDIWRARACPPPRLQLAAAPRGLDRAVHLGRLHRGHQEGAAVPAAGGQPQAAARRHAPARCVVRSSGAGGGAAGGAHTAQWVGGLTCGPWPVILRV